MMAQPAVALGLPLRLLAEAEGVSAAQVIPDHVVGDYRDLDTLRTVTDGCAVVTFDHEHVPTEHLHALEDDGRRRPARPGGAGARPGQGRDARPARRARRPVPAQRARRLGGRRRGVRVPVRAQDDPGRVRRQGRLVRVDSAEECAEPFRGRRGDAASGCWPRSGSTSAASCPRWWPARRAARRRRTRSSRRPSATASATRWSPPRPTSTPALAGQAQEIALRIAGALDVTGDPRRRAVRDHRRPGAGQRAGDAAAQHRPLDPGRRGHLPVREPPARGAGPAARLARAAGAGGR